MRALLILGALLALPASARADLSLPAEVVPGEHVVVGAEAGLAGAPVRLSVAGEPGGAPGGVVAPDGVARFAMPATYGERRFLPGQRLDVSVCSIPVVTEGAGIMASSTFCLGGTTVVGGRVRALLRGRVEPRRVGVLRSARWSNWGGASARARGVVAGRRATAVATGLVDCGDFVAYSTLTVRGEKRNLNPC